MGICERGSGGPGGLSGGTAEVASGGTHILKDSVGRRTVSEKLLKVWLFFVLAK